MKLLLLLLLLSMLSKICPASFRETCQWLKFLLNGLRAQSRVRPVVRLLHLVSGPAILDKLLEYKRIWIQHVNRVPRNRLPRVMKYYFPTCRRNHGRTLKRLLDTWDQNGSTSGLTPWKIYYYYYYYYYYLLVLCRVFTIM